MNLVNKIIMKEKGSPSDPEIQIQSKKTLSKSTLKNSSKKIINSNLKNLLGKKLD